MCTSAKFPRICIVYDETAENYIQDLKSQNDVAT